MSKKVKIVSAVLGGVMACALGVTNIADVQSAKANNVKTEFSTEITATKLAHGQKVNILPYELMLWDQCEEFNASYLNGLYEYSDLHGDFLTAVNSGNNVELVDIYHQADAFQPESNVLKWESSLEGVASYTVRVALDKKFTQCVLKVEDADLITGVALENPLVGTNYYWQVIATMDSGDKVYSPIFDFSTEDSLRTVAIDGVSNTRDVGGYETVYGYVQQGLVYRSARLESITEDGLNTLKNELGIKTDLDLRGISEATTGPNSANPAQLDNYYVYVTPQYALAGDLGLDSAGHWENVGNIMKVFADKDNYPIDVHCAVGRDRTGTITALLKALLGYSENDIINDYFVSMFATTGAWSKETTYTNSAMIINVVNYLNSFEGETLADKTAAYLMTKCGITQEEINSIRDIMTGKSEVENPVYNTFVDENNYADCAFVTFEKYGEKKVVSVVRAGETVEAPFEAGEGYEWIVNGELYDFAVAVNGDITIQAVQSNACAVKILSTGAIKTEETLTVQEGEAFDFALLEKSGYDFVVLSSEGKVLTELTVSTATTINVIYTEK